MHATMKHVLGVTFQGEEMGVDGLAQELAGASNDALRQALASLPDVQRARLHRLTAPTSRLTAALTMATSRTSIDSLGTTGSSTRGGLVFPLKISAVCSYCTWGHPLYQETADPCLKETHSGAFRLPQGLAMSKARDCVIPPILLMNDAFVPVTHVGGPMRGPTDSGGLWFYYTPGCSDLLWHLGRTMLANNRVHAAVLVEQRMARHQGFSLSDAEAVDRVASYIETKHPKWPGIGRGRAYFGKNTSVAALIAQAARGLYGDCKGASFGADGALRPCVLCSSGPTGKNGTRHEGTKVKRAMALSFMAGDKILSLHSEPLLRQLPIDTLTLHQQPQGNGQTFWTTEIWDLRGSPALSRHLEDPSAHPEVVRRSRRWLARGLAKRGGGAECEPAPSWHTCMSCLGSQLEPHCNATERFYAKKSRAHVATRG